MQSCGRWCWCQRQCRRCCGFFIAVFSYRPFSLSPTIMFVSESNQWGSLRWYERIHEYIYILYIHYTYKNISTISIYLKTGCDIQTRGDEWQHRHRLERERNMDPRESFVWQFHYIVHIKCFKINLDFISLAVFICYFFPLFVFSSHMWCWYILISNESIVRLYIVNYIFTLGKCFAFNSISLKLNTDIMS